MKKMGYFSYVVACSHFVAFVCKAVYVQREHVYNVYMAAESFDNVQSVAKINVSTLSQSRDK